MGLGVVAPFAYLCPVRLTLTAIVATLMGLTAAPAVAADPIDYVALGDSFTAAPMVPGTSLAGGCIRSTGNYPHRYAAKHPRVRLTDVSCSAATTSDVYSSQHTAWGDLPPQLDAVNAGTDLVTISLGGNDEGLFGTLTDWCANITGGQTTGSPCKDAMANPDGTDWLATTIPRTQERIKNVVLAVKAKAPHARIVLIGYPRLVPTKGRCDALPLADGDYAYAFGLNLALNRAVQAAARETNVKYLNLWRASRRHDICAKVPWVNGKDTVLTAAYKYHPFANEQAAIARMLHRRLR